MVPASTIEKAGSVSTSTATSTSTVTNNSAASVAAPTDTATTNSAVINSAVSNAASTTAAATGDNAANTKDNKDTKTHSEAAANIFAVNNEECILLQVPAGKPNRKSSTPARVDQPGQKGPTCAYYAPNYSAILEPNYLTRQKESDRKAASNFRKRMSKLSEYQELRTWVGIMLQDSTMIGIIAASQNLNPKQSFIQWCRMNIKIATEKNMGISPEFIAKATALIERFEKSTNDHLVKFLDEDRREAHSQATKDFIADLGLDINEVYQRYITERNNKFTSAKLYSDKKLHAEGSFDKMPAVEQDLHLCHISAWLLIKIFNLKPIKWSPVDNIDVLFNAIKSQGSPIKVSGYYGKDFYNKPSIDAPDESVTGYHIKGWPKGSHKGKVQDSRDAFSGLHVISVIGVRKNKADNVANTTNVTGAANVTKGSEKSQGTKATNGAKEAKTQQGYVYFLDPNIPSPVNAPRPVFKISYEQFCEYCMDELNLNHAFNNKNLEMSLPDGYWRSALTYGYQRQKTMSQSTAAASATTTASAATAASTVTASTTTITSTAASAATVSNSTASVLTLQAFEALLEERNKRAQL